jgi:flagellar motor switch protein FliG
MSSKTGLTGADKAAVLLLALGEERGGPVWEFFDDDEVRLLTASMSKLGNVPSDVVNTVISEFVQSSSHASVHGSQETARRILESILPEERVTSILEELGSPQGKNIWHRLTGVRDDHLINHLRGEHPQTIAVVLARLKPVQSAKILASFDDDLALHVLQRMLVTENISKQAMEDLEESLRLSFMTTLSQSSRKPVYEGIAEILNALETPSEERIMRLLREKNEFEAERIRRAMFTFDDLSDLDQTSSRVIMQKIDKADLAKALKGATARTRDFFMGLMTTRTAKVFADEMQSLGPLRLKEVDEARQRIITKVKELEESGEILIIRGGADALVT